MKDKSFENCCSIKILFENDTIRSAFSENDILIIKKFLKNQSKIDANKYFIRHEIVNYNESCIGLYFIESLNLKKQKLKAFIPLLKFKNDFKININYENGKQICMDSLSVYNDITNFKEGYKYSFSEKEMNIILSYYKYGIQYAPKERIYIK